MLNYSYAGATLSLNAQHISSATTAVCSISNNLEILAVVHFPALQLWAGVTGHTTSWGVASLKSLDSPSSNLV